LALTSLHAISSWSGLRILQVFIGLSLSPLASFSWAQDGEAPGHTLNPAVSKFISHMARENGFDAKALRRLFAGAKRNPEVIRLISAPATSRPWYQFRRLCIDQDQIDNGVDFWRPPRIRRA
jgi:membrane-bound lytic murein transglycosylase B